MRLVGQILDRYLALPKQASLARSINPALARLLRNSIHLFNPVVALCQASHGLFAALLEFPGSVVAQAAQNLIRERSIT